VRAGVDCHVCGDVRQFSRGGFDHALRGESFIVGARNQISLPPDVSRDR
jgi:hypothetical protein